MATRPWPEVKRAKTKIDHENDRLSSDDVRRELEALGLTSGLDRNDLRQKALDAYSEVWEPSRKLQMDHEKALLHAIAACADMIRR